MKFDPDTDIGDLTGKVILVTGGNIGLGKETVYQLSKHNPAHIYLAARSKFKADAAIAELKQAVPQGAPITFLELDLASVESIKKAADTFNASADKLDILFNNAGIMACPAGQTKEGYEIQFGTNHVGHALLTHLLLPKLKQAVAKTDEAASNQDARPDVRIINLSSAAHTWAPPNASLYQFDEMKTPTGGISSTWARYGQSKLANIHYNRELSRRYPDIKCISLHPGSVGTNLTIGPQQSYPYIATFIRFFSKYLTTSVPEGTKNQLWAATSPEAKSGTFYFPIAVEGKDSPQARDDALAKKLWDWTQSELEAHGCS